MAANSDEIFKALVRGRRAINGGLDDAGDDIVEGIQRTLSTPYPGPSAPGSAPHRRTGRLQRQIDAQGARGLSITIVFRAFYARFLEFGTRKMAKRPFIRIFMIRQGGFYVGKRVGDAIVRAERKG